MDPLTHALSGAVAGRAFVRRPDTLPGQVARAALFLGTIFPDGDVIFNLLEPNGLGTIRFHRGVTHSYVCAPLFAAVLGLAAVWICRRLRMEGPSWPRPSWPRMGCLFAAGELITVLLAGLAVGGLGLRVFVAQPLLLCFGLAQGGVGLLAAGLGLHDFFPAAAALLLDVAGGQCLTAGAADLGAIKVGDLLERLLRLGQQGAGLGGTVAGVLNHALGLVHRWFEAFDIPLALFAAELHLLELLPRGLFGRPGLAKVLTAILQPDELPHDGGQRRQSLTQFAGLGNTLGRVGGQCRELLPQPLHLPFLTIMFAELFHRRTALNQLCGNVALFALILGEQRLCLSSLVAGLAKGVLALANLFGQFRLLFLELPRLGFRVEQLTAQESDALKPRCKLTQFA